MYHYVTELEALPLGSPNKFDVDGTAVVVIRVEDGVYATQARCPHMLAPLNKGTLIDGQRLRCGFHRAEFDIRTGEVCRWANFPPGIQALNFVRGEKDLTIYPTKVEDGKVFVSLTAE